jgi:hypothetical protein
MKFNAPEVLLRLQLALKHRRERHVQSFADLEQARRADPAAALLILLNLLKRDAQFLAEVGLAHVEREAPLEYPSADILVDGARGPRRLCFPLCFFHLAVSP